MRTGYIYSDLIAPHKRLYGGVKTDIEMIFHIFINVLD